MTACRAQPADPFAAQSRLTRAHDLQRDRRCSSLNRYVAERSAQFLTVILALFSFVDIPWYVSLPLALGLLLIPAYYHLKRNTVSYTLTDSKVTIDQGLIARTTRNIPLRNIQDVTVSATIPQRVLGFGNLIIDNASEQGGTTILRNIDDPRHHADLLLRELRRWR